MSTQKPESRSFPAAQTCRQVPSMRTSPCRTEGDERCRLSMKGPERAGARGCESPARIPRRVCAAAGATARCQSILGSILGPIWIWIATTFLQQDQPIGLLVRPISRAERAGSPPTWGCRTAAFGSPASPGHPAIPFPSSQACLHSALPHAPADLRRAERYDGQGNLYLLHAA